MTFADLRALHAVIGVAIDDIERVYRPQQRPGSRRPSQSSAHPNQNKTPFPPGPTRSSCSSNATDSEVDESVDADVSTPPTPISPTFSNIPTNNNVRFASSGNRGFRRVRERAHTLSSLPQPSFVPSSGVMPPPILKQPPLDWPPLDAPLSISSSVTAFTSQVASGASPSPRLDALSTPDPSPSPSPRFYTEADYSTSPLAPVKTDDDAGDDSKPIKPNVVEVDGNGETPRQREWRQKCEELTSHPEVINAVNRIVAACGQMAAMMQKPFLTLCDAAMGYHLPACLRFLEASHTVEILREAGSRGMHVEDLAKCISSARVFGGDGGVDPNKLSHILRLLATHHITRELQPDVFANNRVSSLMDSGKSWRDLVASSAGGKDSPEQKYEGTDGTAAFIGLCTDELFKAAAYLTDCYLYPVSSPPSSPTKTVFSIGDIASIPPIPPMPTHTFQSISEPIPSSNVLGIHMSNGSTTSLLSPMARLRKKKSEKGLTLNLSHTAQSHPNGPMTFAQNPHQASPNSLFRLAHKRGHSRVASYASSSGEVPASPPPPPPPTPSRHGILKRLSTRSITPTPENTNLPAYVPPVPSLPVLPPLPNTPRSPMARSTSSACLSAAYNSHNMSTPKSTPFKERDRDRSVMDLNDMLSTPRSNPGNSGNAHLVSTPRSTPARDSLRTMTHVNLQLHNTASSRNAMKTSPPTPRSPLVTRQKRSPAAYDGNDMQASVQDEATHTGQGLLGPAFDLRPPILASSPRSRTFLGPVTATPMHASADETTHVYASPLPPLIPPKSSLRSLRSSASASTTSLVSLQDDDQGVTSRNAASKTTLATKNRVDCGSEMYAPFNLAFNTRMRYFEWLEKSENAFRLKRFGKAMTGTLGWEIPGSVIGAFSWHELPRRSVVVDVGGGIGSTSMLLANAFPHLRFVIQDRPPVAEMGTAAWRARYPHILDSGRAVFQSHDFFKPQPPIPAELNCRVSSPESGSTSEGEGSNVVHDLTHVVPAVFLMRVITHDWPDSYVTRILLQLRQAAGPNTKLVLADFVLPLACVDEDELPSPEVTEADTVTGRSGTRVQRPLAGTVRTLAPEGSPLLPNLGKASAVGYWLDLTMRSMFNAQERTLRELTALTLTAGWKIVQVTRADGSLFGHITAVPVEIPPEALLLPPLDEPDGGLEAIGKVNVSRKPVNVMSPSLGDTFLTISDLPSDEVIRRSVLTGFRRTKAKKSDESEKGKKRGRERSSTFTSQGPRPSKDGKGSEVKKGLRTIMRMLSKSQLRGGEGSPSHADQH